MAKFWLLGFLNSDPTPMKILLIGFIALACMGTTTINGKLYLSSAKEMAPAPLEKQRRIGNIDLYYKNAKKEQPVKKLRTVLNKEHIADFDSLMVSRFFIRSRNNPLLIQESMQLQIFPNLLNSLQARAN